MSKLTNQDFRALLAPTDRKAAKHAPPQKTPAPSGLTAKERNRLRYAQILQRRRQREKPQGLTETSPRPNAFRDRAAERREWEKSTPKVELLPEVQAARHLTEEESKHLGGDVEHTHLVKGLDYILLNRVRTEIEEKEQEKATSGATSSASETQQWPSAPANSAAAALSRRIKTELVHRLHPHHVGFQKKLDKIDTTVLRGAHFRDNTTNFLPGRALFQFDLKPAQELMSDVPLLIFQSSSHDTPAAPSNGCIAPVHWRILEHLREVLGLIQDRKKTSRSEQPARQRALKPLDALRYFQEHLTALKPFTIVEVSPWSPPPSALEQKPSGVACVADDDEDIFAGVGTFDPSEAIASADAARAHATADVEMGFQDTETQRDTGSAVHRLRYFDDRDVDSGGYGHPNVSAPQVSEGTTTAGGGGLIGSLLAGTARPQRSLKTAENPAEVYGECYPSLAEVSDDEGKRGRRRRRRRRDSGSDDEEFNKKPMTARALRRQADRDLQRLGKLMESKSGRSLDSLQEHIQKSQKSSSGSAGLPHVL